MTNSTFEFTAFSEADLLQSGDSNLGCGDTFTMPASATTCISVTDNDAFLSGDSWCNENANDQYGQQASITGEDGGELGNGGQIYAEVYHWVSDADGNWYVMIEIEQEGAGGDYFTFFNGYGYETPPAGAELTVHGKCNVTSDWVDYKCLDAGDKEPPTGSVAGTLFNDADCDGVQDADQCILGDNLFVNGDFEDNSLANAGVDYNIESTELPGWFLIGSGRADVFEKSTSFGNAEGDAFVELDQGAILCQEVDIPEAGTYVFSFDLLENPNISSSDNRVKIFIDGVEYETVVADGQTTVTFEIELQAGSTRFDFKSLSDNCGKGPGIDDISLQKKTIVEGEDGVEGVTVVLLDVDGNEILDDNGERIETVTDADGNYAFDGIPEGDYRVSFEKPDGTEFTFQNAGSDDAIDSDVNSAGVSDVFTITGGETTENIDAGVKEAIGAIEGTVFFDADCDGVKDEEVCILGDNLVMNGDFEQNGLNDTGWGLFDSLPGGWYAIQDKIEVQESNYDTGNVEGNAVVELDANANAIICQEVDVPMAGTYQFSIDYSMRGTNPGTNGFAIYIDGVLQQEVFPNTPGFQTLVFEIDLPAGATRIDLKGLGDSDCIGTVIDNVKLQKKTVVEGEDGVEGVTVVLLDANGDEVLDGNGQRIETVTNADGDYNFADVPPGEYRVKFENPDGTEFTFQNVGSDDTIDSDANEAGVSDVFTVVSGETTENIDAGLKDEPDDPAPGSLSGTYFCDDDKDGVDDGAANGDADIAGKMVMLFNADGVTPAVDNDGNPVAAVMTDANGDYRFDNLAAGDYVVMFESSLAENKGFIAPNVGQVGAVDAADDSDVIDAANGKTAPVTVVAGEETTDVDAGVEDLNIPPVAEDDIAAVCGDAATMINVLMNDYDPDSDPPINTITAVNGQAVGEGDSVTLASGAVVTLMDGKLIYDVSGDGDSFDDLLIGDMAMDQFVYTIADDEGATDTATVDVTVCGAKNTLETIDQSLPDQVTFTLENLGLPDYWQIDIDSTDDRLDTGGFIDLAYCVDVNDDFLTGVPLVANVYLAADASPDGTPDQIEGLPDGIVVNESNLDLVNWIINQGFEDTDNGDGTATNFTEIEIQQAIWFLTNGDSVGGNTTVFDPVVNPTQGNIQEIVDLAFAGGEGFVAGEGDIVGIILDPVIDDSLPDTLTQPLQPFIVGIEFDDLKEDCICIL